MTGYTPNTEEIKEAWNRRYDGEHTSAPRAEREKYDAEFDRWLAEHDREVKAQARDEGYNAGWDDGRNAGWDEGFVAGWLEV